MDKQLSWLINDYRKEIKRLHKVARRRITGGHVSEAQLAYDRARELHAKIQELTAQLLAPATAATSLFSFKQDGSGEHV